MNSVVQNSYINIPSHGIHGAMEVKYEYGENETPKSIGIAAGIFYAYAKDSDNFYVMDNLSDISFFLSSFEDFIDTEHNTIRVESHSFNTGDRVIYSSGGGTDLAGLSSFQTYYVIKVSSEQIKLASSAPNASANIPVEINSVGEGYSHCIFKYKTLTPATAPEQFHKIDPLFRNNQVLIVPSRTTIERNAISPLVNGMLIYNSTLNKFQGRENGTWVNLYEPV